jgi:hydroxymethylbilane synthase
MIIGTRGSRLALWQAEHIRDRLAELGVTCELKIIRTQGDRIQNVTFDKLEGKGFFTSELEHALQSGAVDVAVHSLKDLPTEQPPALVLGAIPRRANPQDMLLIRPEAHQPDAPLSLKPGTVVGTSSARRCVQLLDRQPDLTLLPLRGNVPTRIGRLVEGRFGAIVLAAAGLERLELLDEARREGLVLRPLAAHEMVSAPGQGALGVQCRKDDARALEALRPLHDPRTASAVALERELLAALGGGCQLPLGALARPDAASDGFELWAAWSAVSPVQTQASGTDLLREPAGSEVPVEDPDMHSAAVAVPVVRSYGRGDGKALVEQVAASLRRKAAAAPADPLAGRTIWITAGDEDGAQELAERLQRRGAAPWVRPLVGRQPLPCQTSLAGLAGGGASFDLVFLPSKTAVTRLAEELEQAGYRDLRSFPPAARSRIAAMGPATARAAAERLGVAAVDHQASGESSAALGARLLAETWTGSPPQALMPRARDGRTELQELLRGAGWRVTELDLYRTEALPPTAEELARLAPDSVVLLASPSAVHALLEAPSAPDARLRLVSIGPTTTRAALEAGLQVECQAPAASLEGLEEALHWAPGL